MINKRYIPLFAVILFIWAVYGFFGISTGSLLPDMAQTYRISYTLQGLLVTLGSIGAVVGSLLGGQVVDRRSPRAAFLIGLSMACIAFLAMPLARYYWLAAGMMFTQRMGLRIMEIGANTVVVKLGQRGSAVIMSVIHFCSSIGSTLGTLFMAWALGVGWSWMFIMMLIGIPIALSLGGSLAVPMPPLEPSDKARRSRSSTPTLLRSGTVWILGGMLTFSMLLEGGVSTWGVTYLQGARAMASDKAVLMLSAFCVAMMLGRLVCGPLAEKVGYLRFYLFSILGGAVTVLLAILIPGAPWLLAVTGLFTAGGYPIFMCEIGHRYSHSYGSVYGLIISLASAGSLLGQFILGRMADLMGVARFYYLIPLAGLLCVVLSAALMIHDRRSARRADAATA